MMQKVEREYCTKSKFSLVSVISRNEKNTVYLPPWSCLLNKTIFMLMLMVAINVARITKENKTENYHRITLIFMNAATNFFFNQKYI